LVQLDRKDEALPPYQQALAIRRQLAAENPAVMAYHEALAAVELALGRLQERNAAWPEAAVMYRQAVEHQRGVVATTPASLPARRSLAQQLGRLGLAERRVGRSAQALDDYREACALLDHLEHPTAEEWYDLAACQAACADLLSGGKVSSSESERAEVQQA